MFSDGQREVLRGFLRGEKLSDVLHFFWVTTILTVYVVKLGGVVSLSKGAPGEVGSGVIHMFGGISGVMVVKFSR